MNIGASNILIAHKDPVLPDVCAKKSIGESQSVVNFLFLRRAVFERRDHRDCIFTSQAELNLTFPEWEQAHQQIDRSCHLSLQGFVASGFGSYRVG